MSAQCPQTVPRSSAKIGEGRRRLNVCLTCDFTLTMLRSRGRCEAICEADTALITQRSQVQILPPLQSETASQSRVRGSPRSRLWRSVSARSPLTLPRDGLQRASSRILAKPGEGRRKVERGDLLADDPEVGGLTGWLLHFGRADSPLLAGENSRSLSAFRRDSRQPVCPVHLHIVYANSGCLRACPGPSAPNGAPLSTARAGLDRGFATEARAPATNGPAAR